MAAQLQFKETDRLRNFVFTDFNTTQEHIDADLLTLSYKYLIFGLETCPTTGRQHLQGYCEIDGQIRFSTLKTKMPQAHIEKRKGTGLQASTYCKKEGHFVELGQLVIQGKRTDLDTIRAQLTTTGRFVDVVMNGGSLEQLKYAQMILPYVEPQRSWKPTVYWFWGPTGTGKTLTATRMAGDGYYMKDNTKWWNGYDGNDNVVIDELRPGQFPFEYLLRLLDRYPFQIEQKGGCRQFLARNIWITTPYEPMAFCSTVTEVWSQLSRRLDHVRLFENTPPIALAPVNEPPEAAVTEVGGNTRPPLPLPEDNIKQDVNDLDIYDWN